MKREEGMEIEIERRRGSVIVGGDTDSEMLRWGRSSVSQRSLPYQAEDRQEQADQAAISLARAYHGSGGGA